MNEHIIDPEDDDFDIEQYSREKEEARQQKEFLDFAALEEISGTIKGVPHSSRIPAEIVRDGGGTIEVIADHHHETEEDTEPQILVHRTPEGEISLVEIICTCGKKIKLQLHYTETKTE